MRQEGLIRFRKNPNFPTAARTAKTWSELLDEFMILLVLKVLKQIKHLPGVVPFERELK